MYAEKPVGGTFKPAPEGVHQAVCSRIVDLGTQVSEYQGQQKIQRKILVTWEFPHEMKDGFTTREGEDVPARPHTIHQRYTFSFYERSRLRQDLEAWRGRPFTEDDLSGPPNGFHLAKLLGVNCQINVIHAESNGKTYANIKGIMPLAKGMPKVSPSADPVYFDMSSAETFSQMIFDGLSEYTRKDIALSPEFKELVATGKAITFDSGEDYHQNEASKMDASQQAGEKQHFDIDDEIPF